MIRDATEIGLKSDVSVTGKVLGTGVTTVRMSLNSRFLRQVKVAKIKKPSSLLNKWVKWQLLLTWVRVLEIILRLWFCARCELETESVNQGWGSKNETFTAGQMRNCFSTYYSFMSSTFFVMWGDSLANACHARWRSKLRIIWYFNSFIRCGQISCYWWK